MIEFENSETRRLFLKYAIPCGCVLVKRGNITQDFLDNLENKLANKENISDDLSKIWPFGTGNLLVLAKKLRKEKIDKEIIHKYFWELHTETVLERNSNLGDINVKQCLVLPARIKEIRENKLIVETPLGGRDVKSNFLDSFEVGDVFTIHYNHAIEKISEETASKIENILRKFNNKII